MHGLTFKLCKHKEVSALATACLQGLKWTYAQLAMDLLGLHDSRSLKIKLSKHAVAGDGYGKSNAQDAAIVADMHAVC